MTAGNVSSDEAAPKRAASRRSTPFPSLRRGMSAADAARVELPAGARPARNAIVAAAVIGYAWLLGGAAPFSARALIEVLLPGAVLGVIAYARPPERIPAPESVDTLGLSYWIIALALLFEWEASAVRDDTRMAPITHRTWSTR